MKTSVFALIICLSLSTLSLAEELTDKKKAAIKELMDITGAAEIGQMFSKAVVEEMSNVLKQSNPNVPELAFTIMAEETNAVVEREMSAGGNFYKLIYPIYHKYFTNKDLNALIKFYKSRVGKKTISVLPSLT